MKLKLLLLVIGTAGVLGSAYFYFRSIPKPDFSDRGNPVICESPMNFSDYPAESKFDGPVAHVSYDSNTRALDMQNEIDHATSSGKINFAGKYILAEKICGKSCQDHAVIDAQTGKIAAFGLHTAQGVDFKSNSRLLVLNPQSNVVPSGAARNIPRYYELKDDGFHYLCEDHI